MRAMNDVIDNIFNSHMGLHTKSFYVSLITYHLSNYGKKKIARKVVYFGFWKTIGCITISLKTQESS